MRVLLLLTIVLFSCQSRQQTKAKEDQKELKTDSTLLQPIAGSSEFDSTSSATSFPDSIAKGYELSFEQIKKWTLIDSVYYTGFHSQAQYTGDTVFALRTGYKGAIINYDDRLNCIYKFLLILDSNNQNTAYKIIYTNCDRDPSANYISNDYRLLSDSSFETIETFVPANSETEKTEKQEWKISNTGSIVPFKL